MNRPSQSPSLEEYTASELGDHGVNRFEDRGCDMQTLASRSLLHQGETMKDRVQNISILRTCVESGIRAEGKENPPMEFSFCNGRLPNILADIR